MKIRELKENEPLKITEAYYRSTMPESLLHSLQIEPYEIVNKRVYEVIFTDGDIDRENPQKSENVDEYRINGKKYPYNINFLRSKDIYFRNYTYVIKITIAKKMDTINGISGWFDIVLETSINLHDRNDTKALKEAKRALEIVMKKNTRNHFSSALDLLFSHSKKEEYSKLREEKIANNIYALKKK